MSTDTLNIEVEVFDINTLTPPPKAEPVAIKVFQNGVISFSNYTAEKLNIKAGAKIKILRNKNAPNEWFLAISIEDNAFVLSENKKSIQIKNKILATFLIKNMSVNQNVLPPSIIMRIGTEIISLERYPKCFAILVASQREFVKK